ncbi:hypothetical protein IFR05_003885 [Cadophora sp. M221]|nr:hypothetical protein IFR05_003885 [Cadophora sp. M221]
MAPDHVAAAIIKIMMFDAEEDENTALKVLEYLPELLNKGRLRVFDSLTEVKNPLPMREPPIEAA